MLYFTSCQDEAVKDVQIKGGREAKVKEITIKDSTGTVNVSLWDTQASTKLNCGKTVRVNDGVVKYSTFHNANTISVNDLIEQKKHSQGKILAISSSSRDDEGINIIFVDDVDSEIEIKSKKSVFESYLNIEDTPIEHLLDAYIAPLLPLSCVIKFDGDELQEIV